MRVRDMNRFADLFWGSWGGFERLTDELGRLSDFESLGRTDDVPSINVWTSENGAVVTAQLPGVPPDEIQITAEGRSLTITGPRSAARAEGEATVHRQEIARGTFVRAIGLPFEIDAEGIEARSERGVLEVRLPRAAQDRPRRIPVRATSHTS